MEYPLCAMPITGTRNLHINYNYLNFFMKENSNKEEPQTYVE